ncbi:MAG TPA: hypothetical protein VFA59_16395 [Vicinamibacterales bacterium]|nr:hypothetical protein [Vicinamibacterales bacterium]
MKQHPDLFQAPGPARFVRETLDDIDSSRNVIALLPPGLALRSISNAVQSAAWLRHWDVIAAEDDSSVRPEEVFLSAIGLSVEPSAEPNRLLRVCSVKGLPKLVIVDVGRAAAQRQVEWVQFVSDWGRISRLVEPSQVYRPQVCLIIAASVGAEYAYNDVSVILRPWWGLVDARDVALLVSAESAVPIEWSTALLASLAAGDLELAHHLTNSLATEKDLLLALSAFRRDEWSGEVMDASARWIREHGTYTGDTTPRYDPPHDGLRLWAVGALQLFPDWGIEVHSAILQRLGKDHELRHRLWRGQVSVVLPALNALRLDLCTALSSRHGKKWPSYVAPDDRVDSDAAEADPLNCGFGHLEALLAKAPQLRNEKQWLGAVRRCRQVRNELAHYRPVSLEDYRFIVKQRFVI